MAGFLERIDLLPRLGLGVSTEYGAGIRGGALDPNALRRKYPEYAQFLEVGVEVTKGLDAQALAWARGGAPTTYHFLDLNLDDPDDFETTWLDGVRSCINELQPAWLCGDAGLWHFGARDRGQMLLLPPVLVAESIEPMAAGLAHLRTATGREVLPENPPGSFFVGPLHMLEFFARVAEAADTGLLIDCAHLAMFQRARGYEPRAGFDNFSWDRVIELHVAGGIEQCVQGFSFVEDEHGPHVLDDTWAIFTEAVERATNLRAVVIECERNAIDVVLPLFERVATEWKAHP